MVKLEVGDAELGVLARMLRKVEFFTPLTVGQIEQVLPHVRLYSYEKGETVFKQGDPGDAFYIIHTGSVEVRLKKGFFSFSQTVAVMPAGAFFGEMALISSEPRSASIVCAEHSQLFCLVAADFQFILNGNPAAHEEMKRIAARRKFDSAHR
jgi:trk system potassium uptake protein TrkA